MSRARKTEPEAAVRAAQLLFWKHGYCQLGTRQIEAETGLTRFSLQTSFGGKKALFLRTLDTYLDRLCNGFLPRVTSDDLEPVALWFERRANPETTLESGRYGCLMVNSIAEFRGQDSDINQRADRYYQELQDCFRAALIHAKKQGTLGATFDVDTRAAILMGIAVSLNVVALATTDNPAGRQLAASTAQMIREWR